MQNDGAGERGGRCMRRKFFNLVSALSLLFWAATVVLWVRSYYAADIYSWWTPGQPFDWLVIAETGRGEIYVMMRGRPANWRQQPPQHRFVNEPTHDLDKMKYLPPIPSGPDGMSFAYHYAILGVVCFGGYDTFMLPDRNVLMPIWECFALTSVMPLIGLYQLVRRMNRGVRGLCPTCSYNLTGNSSGVCPECGTAAAGKA